jgi:hypothetical protein
MIVYHNHRIVPGHLGGTYERSNVLRCNIAMHAFLHKCLWEQHGRIEDFRAWTMLTSHIGEPSQRGKKLSAATKAKMSAVRRGRKQTPEWTAKIAAALTGKKASDETRSKQRARWAAYTPEQRASIGAKMSAGKRHNKTVH